MAFRATTANLAFALESIERAAASLKSRSQQFVAEIDGVGSNFYAVNAYLADLRNAKESMQSLATTSGLVEYAQDQRNDPTYDIAAEFSAMISAIQAAGDWIVAALNAQSELVTYSAGWIETPTEFSAQQVTQLVTNINTIVSSID